MDKCYYDDVNKNWYKRAAKADGGKSAAYGGVAADTCKAMVACCSHANAACSVLHKTQTTSAAKLT